MNFAVSRKYLLLITLSCLLIAIDQLTKIYIHTQFQLHESHAVIENFFNITYVRNFGAAFGFLSQAPPAFREIFFLMMPPLACLIILYILRGIDERDTKQVLSLSSIFAGALGNYLDRLQFRYVIDFLDFHIYGNYSWPAFNVADMAIVIGVAFLMISMLKEKKLAEQNRVDTPVAAPPINDVKMNEL
ncbi:MAG: signal peptidase II [Bdellovibrionaceae bacterium]|nr:signal peptidase II [Bdellovibrio sp.]